MSAKALLVGYLVCILLLVVVGTLAIGRAKSSPRIIELTELNH